MQVISLPSFCTSEFTKQCWFQAISGVVLGYLKKKKNSPTDLATVQSGDV
jgi:hypothetical protein